MLQPDEKIKIKISNGCMAYMSKAIYKKIRDHPSVRVVEKDSSVHISRFKEGIYSRINRRG